LLIKIFVDISAICSLFYQGGRNNSNNPLYLANFHNFLRLAETGVSYNIHLENLRDRLDERQIIRLYTW